MGPNCLTRMAWLSSPPEGKGNARVPSASGESAPRCERLHHHRGSHRQGQPDGTKDEKNGGRNGMKNGGRSGMKNGGRNDMKNGVRNGMKNGGRKCIQNGVLKRRVGLALSDKLSTPTGGQKNGATVTASAPGHGPGRCSQPLFA